MKFLYDFFHQKVPKSGAEMPGYYKKALICSQTLLAVYFPLMALLFWFKFESVELMPLALFAATVFSLINLKHMSMRVSNAFYTAVTCVWCGWYVYTFGWNSGVQHFLIPLLMFIFFNICEPPWVKLVFFVGLVGYRMGLFAYSLHRIPIHALDGTFAIVLQSVNSVTLYLILACVCILFSTSIQDTERQLRIDNQELHREADTDPLTQLPNRRAMLYDLDLFQESQPNEYFCVAIADIDFFKKVNDTYGHQCGDYTLKQLADLFRERAGTKYKVCRWGGEEFCFFLPSMNIDEAGREMIDLNIAVSKMPLNFEGNDFSITITIGVDEYDFRSPIDAIIKGADNKLYMGKESGRNKVVI